MHMCKSSLLKITAIAVIPLLVIVGQLLLKLDGILGYSLYKIAFIVPPLAYCFIHKISVLEKIWNVKHWRTGLKQSLGLGLVSMILFWVLYAVLRLYLIDEGAIVANMQSQFSVSATTVLLVAPFTIVLNSLLEETFYRGFVFGSLQSEHQLFAYVLSSTLFTVQHLLFTYHWVGPEVLLLGAVGLLFFALIAADLYANYKTIVAPWILHICGDIAMMTIAVWLLL